MIRISNLLFDKYINTTFDSFSYTAVWAGKWKRDWLLGQAYLLSHNLTSKIFFFFSSILKWQTLKREFTQSD